MLAQLRDCAIEWLDGAVGTRQHHTAFHGDENESSQCVDIGAAGHGGFHFDETLTDGFDPSLKITGNPKVEWSVLGMDLKREATERAAVLTVCDKDAFAIAGENGEDALEGFGR